MCGIVGYIGPESPKDVIVNGLRKLEYRGYDSAGVAIWDQGEFKRVRASGKLKELENKLESTSFTGHVGIGHTRWATHGAPNEKNAHPHQAQGVSLVHNGIIENYLEIREELLEQGADIQSDTDTELVAHLIGREVQKTKDLLQAVIHVLGKIRGAYSIVAVWEKDPEHMVAFKNGPPLVVGYGEKQNFVASDVQALVQYTQKFSYLEDFEIASVRTSGIQFFSQDGKSIQKKVVTINWDPQMIEKQGFSHYMLKEIYEQPRAISSVLENHVDVGGQCVRLETMGFESKTESTFAKIERVFIVACGTSFYAAQVAKYFFENTAKVPVEIDIASEFRYRNPIVPAHTLAITISQSGETADTLAAIRLLKELGATTLSICNVQRSSIDREADGHLYMSSGPEIGVASTKAFISTLTLVNLLSLALAKAKNKNPAEKEIVQALLALPSQVETVLSYDKYFTEAAKTLKDHKGFLYLGRGVSFPIAMEGALKLKELAYMHAEGYAAGEMKHGPLALIDETMAIVTIAPTDEHYEKTLSNLEEAKARGGHIIAIGTGDNERLKKLSRRYLGIPKAHWTTNPILSVVPLQLMAFHLANQLGYDVDQPRNLAKSVTVE